MTRRRYFPLLLIYALSLLIPPSGAIHETRIMLDDISQYFEGKNYPSQRWERLLQCFHKWNDTDLILAQDASFAAFYNAWLVGGAGIDDPWGGGGRYHESVQNKTAIMGSGFRTYQIQEKCNYASNVAYYSSAIRICDYEHWFISEAEQAALMKSMVAITSASSWFHGTQTTAGGEYDDITVDMLCSNLYQIAIKGIETSSSVFLAASDIPYSPSNIVEIVDDMAYMPLRRQPSQWLDYLEEQFHTRVPPRFLDTTLAFFAFACSVSISMEICECLIVDIAAPLVVDEDGVEFFRERYFPELKIIAAQENLPLSPWRGLPLFFKTFGAALAFIWSVLFVETGFACDQLYGDTLNLTLLGQFSSPIVDYIISELTKAPETDRLKELYPGASFCRRDSPHALWHELSGEALFEAYVVADEIHRILTKRKERKELGFSETLAATFNSIRGAGR